MRIVITFVLLSLSIISQGQMTKDSLLRKMADEVCVELQDLDLKGKSRDKIEMELGMAMMPIVFKYEKDIDKTFGIQLKGEKDGQAIGKLLGVQLVKSCPTFLNFFLENPEVTQEIVNENDDSMDEELGILSKKGTLEKIVKGEFTYLQIKSLDGKTEKLWWLEHFEGADGLLKAPNDFLNKTYVFKYTEKEVYNSVLNDYIKVKILAGIGD
jgi:hypothetical protein